MSKSLQEKAIDIKGKQYVLVSDRIVYFNDIYAKGSIKTELVSEPDSQLVVVKAIVHPDADHESRVFTGYSQAKWGDGYINKTSALENCETSAVGRALAMMGIGVIDSIASVDEIKKAGLPEQKTPVVDELTQLKRNLFDQFKAHNMTDPEDIKGFIQSVIQKDEIKSVLDGKRVLSALESKAEEEIK